MHNCLKPFCIYLAQFHHLPALSSPAAPSATPKSSPPPTNAASPWSSPACATSGTESGFKSARGAKSADSGGLRRCKRGDSLPGSRTGNGLADARQPLRACSKSGREGPLKTRRAARCAFCRLPAPGLFTKKTGADSGSMETALAPIPLGHHAMDVGANKSLSVKA